MHKVWSIGIYVGSSPTQLYCPSTLDQGILRAADVLDIDAVFVADPFMTQSDGCWYLFFEVFDAVKRRGSIGLATSRDLWQWSYQKVVLREQFHLSYPHVFESDGDYYMVVETLNRGCVSLYRADSFPNAWSFVGPLVSGDYADPSIFWHDSKWWLFVCGSPYRHDVLRLFSAESLEGRWREHPASPIIAQDARSARPAGRVIYFDGKFIRYAQDCFPTYGSRVRAFAIDVLTDDEYAEHEVPHSPVLRPGAGTWNQGGMHHVDAHCISAGHWVACVDGWRLDETRELRVEP
jgi:glycosyl hydrolase family 43